MCEFNFSILIVDEHPIPNAGVVLVPNEYRFTIELSRKNSSVIALCSATQSILRVKNLICLKLKADTGLNEILSSHCSFNLHSRMADEGC